jgi:hypothetical protein
MIYYDNRRVIKMKKELNSFAQLYALIVEHPEVTIIEKNYCLRGKRTIMIRHVREANQNDTAELETYGKKLERDYIVRKTIDGFPNIVIVHHIDCMYAKKMFTNLLLEMEKCSIKDIIVRVGDDEYMPIQTFIDDIKNEIYEAVLYRSDIFEYQYQRLQEAGKLMESVKHKNYFEQ